MQINCEMSKTRLFWQKSYASYQVFIEICYLRSILFNKFEHSFINFFGIHLFNRVIVQDYLETLIVHKSQTFAVFYLYISVKDDGRTFL